MADDKRYRRLSDQFTIKDVGSTLLNHLAKGLYPADEVIREYIQNAIDAHRLWKRDYRSEPEGPIQIEIRGDRLSILDYGIGMLEEEIRRVKSIAVTTKIDNGLGLTGHKGVGIWAGLSYFETLVLATSKRGSTSGYRLTIHFKRIVDSINDRADIGEVMDNNYFIDEYGEGYDEHYTSITLEKPTRSSDIFTDADKVRDAIRRICPCEVDPNFAFYDRVMEWYDQHGFDTFDICVEGVPVYRSFPSSVESFKSLPLTINDVVVAQCWYAINKKSQGLKPTSDELIGFRLFQTSFAMGGENPYSDAKLPGFKILNVSTSNYLAWHIGEIHLTSDDLRPNLQRNQLEESEEARQFIQRLRDFYSKIEDQDRTLSEKRRMNANLAENIKTVIEIYKGFDEQINAILSRDVLVNFTQEDINVLFNIQNKLIEDDQFVENSLDGKKNPHLKDSNVKKLRKKLLDKVGPLLIKLQKSEKRTSDTDEESESELTSIQSEETSTASFPNSVTTPPKQKTTEIDEKGINLAGQKSDIGPADEIFQEETTQSNSDNTKQNGNNQEEKVFDSSSRKIPVSVVIGLLEEVLDNELGKSNDVRFVIVAKLKEKISWVLSDV